MSAIVESPQVQVRRNRMGMWLFFVSEAFLFGGLLIARFFLWGDTRPDLPQVVPLGITAVLLTSSFFMNRAEVAIANDDRKTFQRGLLITAFLGFIFFLGVLIFEWGWTIEDGAFVLATTSTRPAASTARCSTG